MEKVLVFHLGDGAYCVPMAEVYEILKGASVKITKVPGAPEHIAGVFSHRGEIIPLCDPAILLVKDRKLPEAEQKVIVCYKEGCRIGLLADDVSDLVLAEGAAQYERMPFVAGVMRCKDREIPCLDVQTLFTAGVSDKRS